MLGIDIPFRPTSLLSLLPQQQVGSHPVKFHVLLSYAGKLASLAISRPKLSQVVLQVRFGDALTIRVPGRLLASFVPGLPR